MKVSLITMPWGQPVQPNLLMGNIHSILEKDFDVKSYSFHLKYLNKFNDYNLDLRDYQSMIGCYGLGEFIFAVAPLTEINSQEEIKYFEFLKEKEISDLKIQTAKKIKSFTSEFIEDVFIELSFDNTEQTVVFCPMYRELMASFLLAKRIKNDFPNIRIIFAGEVLEGDIETVVKESFEFIDEVVSCDSESQIHAIIANKVRNKELGNYRKLNFLETPNYNEYYLRLENNIFKELVKFENWIPFESSRGCWWAEKSKCSFCALTKTNSTFRKKDIQDTINGIIKLSSRYKVLKFQFFDWIISPSYFENLYPKLIDLNLDFTLYLQSKVNLSKEKIHILKKIGAVVQFGVESLNTETLEKIKKGATMLQNVKALKWSAEYNLRSEWNILYNLPGEGENDIEELYNLLPSLFHLWPPAFNRFRLQKLSPYFEECEKYNIKILKPLGWYSLIYSFLSPKNQSRIAEEFDYEIIGDQNEKKPKNELDLVKKMINEWSDNKKNVYRKLVYVKGYDFLKIIDLRFSGGRREYNLNKIESLIYLFCDSEQKISNIKKHLNNYYNLQNLNFDILKFLNLMLTNRLMISENGKYLSLAISENIKEQVEHPHKSIAEIIT